MERSLLSKVDKNEIPNYFNSYSEDEKRAQSIEQS